MRANTKGSTVTVAAAATADGGAPAGGGGPVKGLGPTGGMIDMVSSYESRNEKAAQRKRVGSDESHWNSNDQTNRR